jgi:hypothetical protein
MKSLIPVLKPYRRPGTISCVRGGAAVENAHPVDHPDSEGTRVFHSPGRVLPDEQTRPTHPRQLLDAGSQVRCVTDERTLHATAAADDTKAIIPLFTPIPFGSNMPTAD